MPIGVFNAGALFSTIRAKINAVIQIIDGVNPASDINVPLARVSGAGTAAAANTGTGASNVPTVSQADARYLRLTGGDLTGAIKVPFGGSTSAVTFRIGAVDNGILHTSASNPMYFIMSGTVAARLEADGTLPASANIVTRAAGDTRYAQRSNNLSDLASAATARTNLGLGTAATVNTGTGASNVPTVSQADARYAQRSNNLSDLASAATARTNLGLGTAATVNTGTGASNVPTVSQADARYDARYLSLTGGTLTGVLRVPFGGSTSAVTLQIGTADNGILHTSASNPMYFIMSGTVAARLEADGTLPASANIVTRAAGDARYAALANAWPGVYTGSDENNTVFPVGTVLAVAGATGQLRNAEVTPRLGVGFNGYSLLGAGDVLPGTWRVSGSLPSDAAWRLIRRVA